MKRERLVWIALVVVLLAAFAAQAGAFAPIGHSVTVGPDLWLRAVCDGGEWELDGGSTLNTWDLHCRTNYGAAISQPIHTYPPTER